MAYEAWGSLIGAEFGNGLSLSQVWTDGRLASKRLFNTASGTNLSSLAYSYDLNDNIGTIRDLIDESRSAYYGYDANDRMSFASIAVGTPTAGTDTFSYTAGTNRLASIVNVSGTRSISYDGRGNTASEARPGGANVSVSYDGYGRLLTYDRTGDPGQTNIYNGLDDRVSVTSAGDTRRYVYDPDGRVIGEYGASASDVIAETIWLQPEVANDNQPIGGDDGVGGYAPLAVATGSGVTAATYWVHGNHLGVPLVTTDASGAAVTPTGYTLPGFPGQLRTLADLYYNRHRDYDSSAGRYIQADPIGLEGGENPYLYAEGNPLKYIDPHGLAPRKLDPNSDECKALAKKIDNLRKEIAKRTREIELNPGKLPEYVPGGKPRESVQGHRTLLLRYKKALRDAEQLYAEKCGGGSCEEEEEKTTSSNVVVGAVGALAVVGGIACAIVEPCGATVAAALTLGGSSALLAN